MANSRIIEGALTENWNDILVKIKQANHFLDEAIEIIKLSEYSHE